MNLPTVSELRRGGCKVWVTHKRYYDKDRPKLLNKSDANHLIYCDLSLCIKNNKLLLAKGGLTEVRIDLPNGDTLTGKAQCSLKDAYNKKLGLQIALGRALRGKYV